MFYQNTKLAFRRMKKTKLVSLINILGLTISLTSFLLIVNYLHHESGFDNFHRQGDRIYRVESKIYENNALSDHWASSPFGCATAMKNELSGIDDLVRVTVQRAQTENIVSTGEVRYREYQCCYTEPSFFRIFSFGLQKGNAAQALSNPNTVVITPQMARKYFGDQDPIGKVLTFSTENSTARCEVTGILNDIPANSHLQYDFFISWNTLPQWIRDFWPIYGVYTYALLKPGVSPESITQQFATIARKYSDLSQMKNKSLQLAMIPLRDIHFNPQLPYEKEQKGNRSNLYVLSVIAIALLIIAWFNYVNLSTALAYERIKEYNVRKLSGAGMKDLISIFINDSVLTNAIAIVLSLFAAILCLPFFNRLTGQDLNFELLLMPVFWISLITLFALGVAITGLAPVFLLRNIKPSSLINGRGNPLLSGWSRQVLVCFQFAASIALIAVTLVVFKQIHFMQSQDPGYRAEQTLAIKFPGRAENYLQKLESFKTEVRMMSNVAEVCQSGVIPGMEVANYAPAYRQDAENPKNQLLQFYPIDFDFIRTYELEIKAGRPISKEFGNDQQKLLINEEAVTYFGFASAADAIGKLLVIDSSRPMEIAGVVNNFHQQSLNKAFLPIAFVYQGTIPWLQSKFISVKISGEIEQTLKSVSGKWATFFPESSFDYFFVDEFFDRQYQSDVRFGQIFGIFSMLTILIACLGLFALSLFASRKKNREIGVRKVNGAQVTEVMILLNRDFVKWVAIAFVIATPIAYYAMNKWLENFAYKTELSWWIFALAGFLALGIALLTVSWQSWKAATRNPVEALRYE